MGVEVDSTRQTQGAAEAVELLRRAGFLVGEFSVETEPQDEFFDLEVELAVEENERPLAAVSACERDDCPRAE
jgi:hypothetical protein